MKTDAIEQCIMVMMDVGAASSGFDASPRRVGYGARCLQSATEASAELDALKSELTRLRKLFDDAGKGEHNVLALVDYYQDLAIAAGAREQELRALLASGQCVDLARVETADCRGRLFVIHGLGMSVFLSEGGTVRQWLIEKAGVKS